MKLEEAVWLGNKLGLKVNPPRAGIWIRPCKCGADGVCVRISTIEEFFVHCRRCRKQLQHIVSDVKMIGMQKVDTVKISDGGQAAMRPVINGILQRYMQRN